MGRTVMTELADLLKPSYVKNGPDCIQVNERLCRIIMAVGYPRTIREGWLNSIISSEGDFDMSIHIKPLPLEAILTQLNQELVKQESDLMAAQMKGIVNPSLKIQHQDTLNILEKLQKGEEKLFNISLYIGARAYTMAKLELLTKKIVSELNSIMVIPKIPFLRMADGAKSVYPIQEDRLKAERNIPSDALAACFPFTTAYLNLDMDGILFGLNKNNNIPIILDPFKFANYNGLILGTSGGGKSVTAKLFILRNLLRGVKTIIIDPQGEYAALTEKHSGQLISLGRESDTTINPLDLFGSEPAEKAIALMDLFRIMLGEITEVQKGILDSAVHRIYGKKGIIHGQPETWGNEPPIMEDLRNEIIRCRKTATKREMPQYESLSNRLDVYVHGTFSFLNRKTNLDLENDLICFNISEVPAQIKSAMMLLVMDFVHRKMRRDRQRKTLVIDEAWSLLRFAENSKSIFELMKTARKFGLGIVVITQEVEDLLSSAAGKTILANTAWKYLSRQEPAAIAEVSEKFNLNDEEKNYLLTALPGEGLLFAMNDHIPIRVIPSPQEYEIITTNPDEVNQREKTAAENKTGKNYSSNTGTGKNYYRLKELLQTQTAMLREKGFLQERLVNLDGRYEIFLVKRPESGESIGHFFMVNVIADEILKYTPNVSIYSDFGPDIVFAKNGKDGEQYYAMEIEIGSAGNKTEDLEPMASRNNYSVKPKYVEWWFVALDKGHKNEYGNIHKTITPAEIREKLAEIFDKKI